MSPPGSAPIVPQGDFAELVDELKGLMSQGVDRAFDDEAFNDLAVRVFQYQYRTNPTFSRFADGRGARPDRVRHWTEIPAVPTTAFKHMLLVSGDPSSVRAVFRTSGTSEGRARRGEHAVLDLDLYRSSLVPAFAAHVLPDGARPRILSLVPPLSDRPDSSLGFMIHVVVETLGGDGSGWFVDSGTGIREDALFEALRSAEVDEAPVVLASTTFGLVHWMDAMDRRGWRVRLPSGSRVMDTGGFKGRSRTVSRTTLYDQLEKRIGVPPSRMINEYGMTELLSQFYEPVLREGEPSDGLTGRRFVGPPWVRTRVLDPRDLTLVPPGTEGVLCHLDLANVGSVSHVLTEDRGVSVEGGFRVLGRAPGASERGCSLAMDEMLEARRA